MFNKDDGIKPNFQQQKVIETTEGPVLVVAGAGTGKTATIVKRVENIIESGLALPWQVLAITFTNKAAGELKERLVGAIGDDANQIWAQTFHSMCVRILRRFVDRLGFDTHFTIYDTDDQKKVIKKIQKNLGIEDKFLNHRVIISEISHAKDQLISPKRYKQTYQADYRRNKIADCYLAYQDELQKSNAMDFDDLIYKTVKLLKENEDVLSLYQKQFKYIIVDEYQDTSYAQYVLTYLLAKGYHNICVVGDDDQSIYKFRGATIENIMRFKERYASEGIKVIQLELAENYRSKQNILDAANAVIKNNEIRLADKRLKSYSGQNGDKVVLYTAGNEIFEAQYVVDTIVDNVSDGMSYKDHAILYRNNAQSRNLEIMLTKSGVSYKIYGGTRFFDRKEIKDIVSYFALINNPADNVRFQRIINVPKRGIGETMVNHIFEIAEGTGMSAFEVCEHADEFAKTARSAKKLKEFCEMIKGFQNSVSNESSVNDLLGEILDTTKYLSYLREDDPLKADDRQQNISELSTMLLKYESENDEFTLADFLEDVALVANIDAYNADEDCVALMTLHSAKGLEFPAVFIVGMEEGMFPSEQSTYDEEEIQEERRLAYVGITRAKEKLYLTNTKSRTYQGKTRYNRASRFVREIPSFVLDDQTPGGFGSNSQSSFSRSNSYSSSQGHWGESHSTYNSSNASNMARKNAQRSAYSHKFGATTASSTTQNTTKYSVGDTVRHKTFGTGVIMNAEPSGNDTILEIAFDRAGTKKIMANFAKMEIV